MTPVENPSRALAISMLELAIEDYVTLREIGAVTGTEIDEGRWSYEINKNWRYRPLGYGSVQSVRELIEFLAGEHFDLLCDYVSTDGANWQAWQFRRRIGLTPSEPGTRLLGTADLWWTMTPKHMRERMATARTGKDLGPPRVLCMVSVAASRYPNADGSGGVIVLEKVTKKSVGVVKAKSPDSSANILPFSPSQSKPPTKNDAAKIAA